MAFHQHNGIFFLPPPPAALHVAPKLAPEAVFVLWCECHLSRFHLKNYQTRSWLISTCAFAEEKWWKMWDTFLTEPVELHQWFVKWSALNKLDNTDSIMRWKHIRSPVIRVLQNFSEPPDLQAVSVFTSQGSQSKLICKLMLWQSDVFQPIRNSCFW